MGIDPDSFILLLFILGFVFLRRWQEPGIKEPFNRQPDQLVFTSYALCRMGCYNLRREDILLVIYKGVILLNKSNGSSHACPIYALQGKTLKGRSIRVLFEQC